MQRTNLAPHSIRYALVLVISGITLVSCGRNPGAQPRSYSNPDIQTRLPGIEKLEKLQEDARAKCVQADLSSLRRQAVIQGKEMFSSNRAGAFRLEAFDYSKVSDRVERIMPNLKIQVTDFDDLVSRAPRLSIEATCIDTKGLAQELKLSPALEIDSEVGMIRQTQPFVVTIPAEGVLSATSLRPVLLEQPIPVSRVPSEAAMLLGAENSEGLKTISFRVKESEDGSMEVNAEFAGVDAEMSRIVIRVRAIYRWDAAA